MNKQQLANKIWASANKMRSKIDANEYKDYILGLIFYKFLSGNELNYLKGNSVGMEDDDIKLLPDDYNNNESDDYREVINSCRHNIGYYIGYNNLFTTWLKPDSDFSVAILSEALGTFDRLIDQNYKSVYDGIFNTLQAGLSKLGDNPTAQTRALKDLITLIKDIPTDGKQDYDVLGYVYEYLISNFAANAGKKAGEFYTPHEVAILMSDIVAEDQKAKDRIKIYDPTSGSGSLLITIGKSIGRHIDDPNHVVYYAQELKENTYNLTRMNLVMRGIQPNNIVTRCADSLAEDWPLQDSTGEIGKPLYVDAVVSNPPYSQHWNPEGRENDPRFKGYGMAPASKADFAFLLHELHHLRPDGIMTIVLPHGVLFRGDTTKDENGQMHDGEGKIRANLIENRNIETIIGLPPNIFFGTGIPTLIMVLKQKRDRSDVLFIDASKGFVKEGKQNRLRACDIKRIADIVKARPAEVPGFSRLVGIDEVRANGYNLNIPRYVDNAQHDEQWDICATMFGGIPKDEIDALEDYWQAMPGLRETLLGDEGQQYVHLLVNDADDTINNHDSVKAFRQKLSQCLEGLDDELTTTLVDGMMGVKTNKEEDRIADNIFNRLDGQKPLIDPYAAYQILDDQWQTIANDIETIQTEGKEAIREVDERKVLKKVKDKEIEVFDGWQGHIIPFDLVQRTILKDESDALDKKRTDLEANQERQTDIIESLAEDEQQVLNDDNTAFDRKALTAVLDELLKDVETDTTRLLSEYIGISKKADKQSFIAAHSDFPWNRMPQAKDGTYSKANAQKLISKLKGEADFPEDSIEKKLTEADKLLDAEKSLKKEIRDDEVVLEEHTIAAIKGLTDEQAHELLRLKWIAPIVSALQAMPDEVVAKLQSAVKHLAEKYSVTFADTERNIANEQQNLTSMIGNLTGNASDMKGLAELQTLLNNNGEIAQ